MLSHPAILALITCLLNLETLMRVCQLPYQAGAKLLFARLPFLRCHWRYSTFLAVQYPVSLRLGAQPSLGSFAELLRLERKVSMSLPRCRLVPLTWLSN